MEIDLTNLGFLSSATTSFLKKSDNLTQLIPIEHPFFSIDNAIKGKADFPREKRQVLVETLRKQYQDLNISDNGIINRNIESLLEPNTYTVTTGQQLHLFLGPAFMVYKLISTIKAAEHYGQLYPDKKFVPVYWLASEDHDFEEIKNTPLFGQKYEWQTTQTGACGTYHLKDLPPLFEQLKQKLANDDKALALISEFESIYNSSATLSDATIKLTHHLFGQYGLLCLDANNHALKTLFKGIISKELLEMKSHEALNGFSRQMSANNLSLQLKSRDINLFYLKGNLRARFEHKDGLYSVIGTDITFTKAELESEIDKYPEHFSPNAVLRPIYQETVLPNIAYIGGNAEINYWLQLKDVFNQYCASPSTLVLRQSVWIMRPKQQDWLRAMNIGISDLFNLKTEQDNIRIISGTESPNLFSSILSSFNKLKAETLDIGGKAGLKNLKLVAENGKLFEKSLKELEKASNDLLIEKNKKDLAKLEQLQNNGFSFKIIQERTVYTLEFLINTSNYLDYCLVNVHAKPGYGYFFEL